MAFYKTSTSLDTVCDWKTIKADDVTKTIPLRLIAKKVTSHKDQ